MKVTKNRMRLIEHRTNIEKIIEDILKDNKLNFIFQYPIRCKFGYIADFFLSDYNLIIECDGERWHNKLKDNHKTFYLINIGYKVLRLKGNEILNNPIKCLNKIQIIIRRCIENGKTNSCEGKRNSSIINE